MLAAFRLGIYFLSEWFFLPPCSTDTADTWELQSSCNYKGIKSFPEGEASGDRLGRLWSCAACRGEVAMAGSLGVPRGPYPGHSPAPASSPAPRVWHRAPGATSAPLLAHLRAWGPPHLPGQPAPSKETAPHVHPNPPLDQLEPSNSSAAKQLMQAEASSSLTVTSATHSPHLPAPQHWEQPPAPGSRTSAPESPPHAESNL